MYQCKVSETLLIKKAQNKFSKDKHPEKKQRAFTGINHSLSFSFSTAQLMPMEEYNRSTGLANTAHFSAKQKLREVDDAAIAFSQYRIPSTVASDGYNYTICGGGEDKEQYQDFVNDKGLVIKVGNYSDHAEIKLVNNYGSKIVGCNNKMCRNCFRYLFSKDKESKPIFLFDGKNRGTFFKNGTFRDYASSTFSNVCDNCGWHYDGEKCTRPECK